MECTPLWIVRKAVQGGNTDHYADPYEVVREDEAQKYAKVIGSHIVHKPKKEENVELRLKARICPTGKLERENEDVRGD